MIFATLTIERDPMQWSDMPSALVNWVVDVGGIATIALLVWVCYYLIARPKHVLLSTPRQVKLFRLALLGALVGWVLFGTVQFPKVFSEEGKPLGPPLLVTYCRFIAGISAIVAVTLPFFMDVVRMRWRRIGALARLSFKEAIRRRVLWAFSGLLLVVLFASWFVQSKPENQVRDYVWLVTTAMTPIMLFTAGLLAAFSIPADLKSQTIHTIVTKPVERFEIVLGRFLGYVSLLTLILVVTTGLSLLYVFRQIDPEAQFESMRARVPVYAKLKFRSNDPQFQGDNVGREWEYRKYIAGGTGSSQRAVYSFTELSPTLANRPEPYVRCEFTFDIFRTLKGEEGKGVFGSFGFFSWHWDPKLRPQYEAERDQLRRSASADLAKVDAILAEKYGAFEVPSNEIADYHTQSIEIPVALFKNALTEPQKRPKAQGEDETPLMQVVFKCDSGGQYIGMSKYDLYLLDSEGRFPANFFKAAVGLWLRICLVIGLAVVFSTYLSGVISLLVTFFIYMSGVFLPQVRELAEGRSVGGGPMESFYRLVKKEALVTPLDKTPGATLAQSTDEAYRWIMRRVVNVLPDVGQLDWTNFLAEGFNIAAGDMLLLHTVVVLGYLIPCALVGYYLMKWREVAA